MIFIFSFQYPDYEQVPDVPNYREEDRNNQYTDYGEPTDESEHPQYEDYDYSGRQDYPEYRQEPQNYPEYRQESPNYQEYGEEHPQSYPDYGHHEQRGHDYPEYQEYETEHEPRQSQDPNEAGYDDYYHSDGEKGKVSFIICIWAALNQSKYFVTFCRRLFWSWI